MGALSMGALSGILPPVDESPSKPAPRLKYRYRRGKKPKSSLPARLPWILCAAAALLGALTLILIDVFTEDESERARRRMLENNGVRLIEEGLEKIKRSR